MFDALSTKISGVFSSLRSRGKLSPSDIESSVDEIRTALLEADVSLSVADSFIERVRTAAPE